MYYDPREKLLILDQLMKEAAFRRYLALSKQAGFWEFLKSPIKTMRAARGVGEFLRGLGEFQAAKSVGEFIMAARPRRSVRRALKGVGQRARGAVGRGLGRIERALTEFELAYPTLATWGRYALPGAIIGGAVYAARPRKTASIADLYELALLEDMLAYDPYYDDYDIFGLW